MQDWRAALFGVHSKDVLYETSRLMTSAKNKNLTMVSKATQVSKFIFAIM
jgi:hypothetical protein